MLGFEAAIIAAETKLLRQRRLEACRSRCGVRCGSFFSISKRVIER